MDGSAGLGNGRATETLCQSVTVAKHHRCSASSVLLAWPQAASSQLLRADATTFPLWLWHWDGKSRREGRAQLLWCWMSSTQRLPGLNLSWHCRLSGLAGQPRTEGASELPIRCYHLKLWWFFLLNKECQVVCECVCVLFSSIFDPYSCSQEMWIRSY